MQKGSKDPESFSKLIPVVLINPKFTEKIPEENIPERLWFSHIHAQKTREMFNRIVLINDLHQMKKLYTSGQSKMPKEEENSKSLAMNIIWEKKIDGRMLQK